MSIVWVLTAYATVGVVFALWFVTRGIGRLDQVARGGGMGFRLIVVPGVVALWPVLVGLLVTRGRGLGRGGAGAGGVA